MAIVKITPLTLSSNIYCLQEKCIWTLFLTYYSLTFSTFWIKQIKRTYLTKVILSNTHLHWQRVCYLIYLFLYIVGKMTKLIGKLLSEKQFTLPVKQLPIQLYSNRFYKLIITNQLIMSSPFNVIEGRTFCLYNSMLWVRVS